MGGAGGGRGGRGGGFGGRGGGLGAADSPVPAGAPLPPQDVTLADVSLPTLGPRLKALGQEVVHGRGFQLLRGEYRGEAGGAGAACSKQRCPEPCRPLGAAPGCTTHCVTKELLPSQQDPPPPPPPPPLPAAAGVPVERWTRAQSVAAYWVMGLHWGKAVSNNKKGHLIGHIKVRGRPLRLARPPWPPLTSRGGMKRRGAPATEAATEFLNVCLPDSAG